MLPKSGMSFDPALIPKAVKDAGFSAAEVVATLDGTLAKSKESVELVVPGLKHPFVLAGGPHFQALEKRTDLVGKRVQVIGKLLVSKGPRVPALTVENFQPLPI